ncbi:MAG: TatD family deoxyribonuclease, partial [Alphaproteobacteria bacterium]
VMHCFSSGAELAKTALDLGFYISLSGIITFKKADDLRDIVKTVPLDRILIETDSPYLAPVPMRGKRNEPAFVAHTAAKLAEIKGVSTEEIGKITTENFYRLFKKVKKL